MVILHQCVYNNVFYNVCCGHVIMFYKEILKDRGESVFQKPSLNVPPHVFCQFTSKMVTFE